MEREAAGAHCTEEMHKGTGKMGVRAGGKGKASMGAHLLADVYTGGRKSRSRSRSR